MTTSASQGGLDLKALERLAEESVGYWTGIPVGPIEKLAVAVPALIDRVRELSTENAELTKDIRHRVRFSEWSPTEAEFESYRDDTEARLASLLRVREAAVELAGMIERFRPLDAAFGSPSPFALIEEAQDKLRAALADVPTNSAATSSRLAAGGPALADSEEGR